jgi:hypothetical protein
MPKHAPARDSTSPFSHEELQFTEHGSAIQPMRVNGLNHILRQKTKKKRKNFTLYQKFIEIV